MPAERTAKLTIPASVAGIGGDGPSKGILRRSPKKFSTGTHRDCADYNYRTLDEVAAIHTSDFSHYVKA